MNFEPIPNLPFGSILCCFQAKGLNAYGTSIGHILLESIDELSGSISSGPISEKISLDSPVRSLKISVCQLEIFILAKTDNGIYLVTMPQLGSSLSCKHHIRKVGFFADEISCSKNKFVWREGNTVFAGNFCLPDEKFKHWTLLHSRSEIIQMELKDEICLIGGRDCLMTCCLNSGEITVLLDVPTFAPFITGACFTSNFAIAACDDSGGIKIVSQNGEILHEVDFGYQSGFKPGRLRYHLATLVSFENSSVTFIDFLENSMNQVPIRGKICDLTCSKREIIGVISGQAMKLRKNEENTDLKKIESAGRCRTDSDIVDVDEAFRSAKGLFFALKKKMKDKIIVSKPVVDKMSESVKHIANNVGSKISKEIFDDEIFESDNHLVPPQMAQVAELALDVDIEDEPVKFERQIKSKVQLKKQIETQREMNPHSSKKQNKLVQSHEKCVYPNLEEEDKINIDNAISKACSKSSETVVPVNIPVREISQMWPSMTVSGKPSSPIEIIPRGLSHDSSSYEQCSSENNSWVVIDD